MALLEAVGIYVRFGDQVAVNDVELAVDAGEVVGLIGPNGAGKTTTFNAIAGVQKCRGTVHLGGVNVSGAPAHRRARLGLNRTFQRLEVFGSMTAFDNLRTAAEIAGGGRGRRDAPAIAARILERLGLSGIAEARADALPTGQARLVELGRALATEPKVVLLDEPASGLDENETIRLAEVLADVAKEGTAVLLVEHDMDLVMRACSRIYVLNLGEVIATGTPKQVRNNAAVRDAYLGSVVA
jgi:branched-chain amino acid transport system ATP-binding protein